MYFSKESHLYWNDNCYDGLNVYLQIFNTSVLLFSTVVLAQCSLFAEISTAEEDKETVLRYRYANDF